ncbi:MAG: NUDIX domain-containing protein [Gemmatimonadales bacterium]
MTDVRTIIVDVYVLRMGAGAPDVLVLRRAPGERCAGTWETVHGHIDAGEAPAAAALRELREEAGLSPERLYNVSRVETFYLHARDVLALIPVFCAIVPAGAQVALSGEHDRGEWLPPEEASRRFVWPRERRALADALQLFGTGDAGGVEDVLRVL